eukprot:TRINITY_DN25989_c0_g1_i1.p1 TRINITY_DN25989_c0_g1~~TRINITY_DN25989_c0_g1_i1.p1  ORF type:complete len:684 (+),score=100.73 TRINITY_DN25989_c0_g1_i1:147-2054(+)
MMSVVGSARDIYLEKFGLDATIFAVLVTIVSFWAPIQEVVMGRLQDKQVLSRIFPLSSWGRRAPWTLTHGILAALAASVMFLPPVGDVLPYVWFLACWLTTCWGISGCIIAFEAARQGIYPFKEERILVEGLCKYACMAGGSAGGLVFLVLSSNAAFEIRLACVCYILPVGLLSLQAVPLFREARGSLGSAKDEACGTEAKADSGGALAILWEALPRWIRLRLRQCSCRRRWSNSVDKELQEKPDNRALQHLLAMKFWNGSYGVLISSMLLYYVTYVLRLSSWARVQVIVGAGMAAGITETVMNLIYMRLFASGDSLRDFSGKSDRRLLNGVVACRLINAALTLLIIGYLEPTVHMLFVWAVVTRIGLCSFSFWRVSAQCWLVDEDCLSSSGGDKDQQNMREGMIFGALSMAQILAAATWSSLASFGLGLTGLETRNCEALCTDLHGLNQTFESKTECIDSCFENVIDGQPESLRLYVRLVIGVLAPLCELLIAYHAYRFPIKGARLRRLYFSVAAQRGDDSTPWSPKAESEADAHFGDSQTVIHGQVGHEDLAASSPGSPADDSDFMKQLMHVTSMVKSRKGTVSVSVRWRADDEEKASPHSRPFAISTITAADFCNEKTTPSDFPPDPELETI